MMQELLQESWKPDPPEEAEGTIPSFDPASPEYGVIICLFLRLDYAGILQVRLSSSVVSMQVLPKRLAKSKVLQDVNRLKLGLKDKEGALNAIQNKKGMDEEKEVC
jgi:hypothetical protein